MSNEDMRGKKYDTSRQRLRAELKAIRLKADLSQEKLAEILSVKQSFISKYERGERNLDFIEVVEICNACGYDVAVLIEDVGLTVKK